MLSDVVVGPHFEETMTAQSLQGKPEFQKSKPQIGEQVRIHEL